MKLSTVDWRALHERLRGIGRRRAMLDAEEARCLREAEAMLLWQHLGYAHMAEYLEREMGYEPPTAAERLRVARALEELPQLEASLGRGALPYTAVRELSRVATGETEPAWIEAALGKTVRQIEMMVSGRKRGDRPSDPADPDLRKRVVRLELSPQVFALFRQVQGVLADEHGGRLEDSAFGEILCRRALEGGGASERPAHQIAITVCESCGRGWQNGAGREIEVGPEVVERARCDAELLGSLDAEVPARVTSTVTPRLRRQVFARDHQRCVVPGCRSARNLDLHHVEYQQDGGRHQIWNIVSLCGGHHARVHEGALRIFGRAPQALEFRWREGLAGSGAAPLGLRAEDGLPHGGAVDADGEVDEAPGSAHSGEALSVEAGPRALDSQRRKAERTAQPCACPAERDPRSLECDAREALAGCRTDEAHPAVERARSQDREAREALTTAGYKAHEARVAVERARSHVGGGATLAELVREALRSCPMARGTSAG